MIKIKIKYHFGDIPRLEKIEKGDWIDLYTAEEITLRPFQRGMINLGVSMELPIGYEANIVPRSSTYKHFNIIQTNHYGVIDHTYQGDSDVWHMPVLFIPEIKEGVDGDEWITKTITIPKHTRLCQFRIQKSQPKIDFVEVEQLGNENRNGFGSTGK